MALHEARWLAWPRMQALAREGAVALLPVGSTEAHGPHLPLSVDVVIAEEVCRRVAARVQRDVVVFPSVAYALTDFAAPFSGTVTLEAQVARQMLEGILSGIVRAGFGSTVVVNHHLEPAHFRVVHDAAKAVQAKHSEAKVRVADHRRAPTGPQLGHEFMHGGSHAGNYETSLMLAAAPHLVNEEIRRALPELAVDLPGLIKGGAQDFLQCGGHDAYFGNPAQATAAEGQRLFEILVGATAAVVEETK